MPGVHTISRVTPLFRLLADGTTLTFFLVLVFVHGQTEINGWTNTEIQKTWSTHWLGRRRRDCSAVNCSRRAVLRWTVDGTLKRRNGVVVVVVSTPVYRARDQSRWVFSGLRGSRAFLGTATVNRPPKIRAYPKTGSSKESYIVDRPKIKIITRSVLKRSIFHYN